MGVEDGSCGAGGMAHRVGTYRMGVLAGLFCSIRDTWQLHSPTRFLRNLCVGRMGVVSEDQGAFWAKGWLADSLDQPRAVRYTGGVWAGSLEDSGQGLSCAIHPRLRFKTRSSIILWSPPDGLSSCFKGSSSSQEVCADSNSARHQSRGRKPVLTIRGNARRVQG